MSSLTGTMRGTSRADIMERAKESAAEYYGTGCVQITLSGEEAEAVNIRGTGVAISATVSFTADWEATVKHHMSQQSYGFAKCIYCKHESGR